MNHLSTAVEEKKEESPVVLTYMGDKTNKENIWYLDNGANNHMCGNFFPLIWINQFVETFDSWTYQRYLSMKKVRLQLPCKIEKRNSSKI